MLRRYELTNQEWEQIAPLLPPEKTDKPGRPAKENRQMLNAMIWIAHSGAPGAISRNGMDLGNQYIAVSASGLMMGFLIISSMYLVWKRN